MVAIDLREMIELTDMLVISANDKSLKKRSRCHENISKTDKIVNAILIATETETMIENVIVIGIASNEIDIEIITTNITIQTNSTETIKIETKETIRSLVCRSLDMPSQLMSYTMTVG